MDITEPPSYIAKQKPEEWASLSFSIEEPSQSRASKGWELSYLVSTHYDDVERR
jgi:hypothetical protein